MPSKASGGIGFRDLKVFNQAMLGKQCWRLLTNEDSLLFRILKARYFPHTTFLEAYRGGCPSSTWRSLWGAKSLLKEGLRWRIGDGTTVQVWEDAWVPCRMPLARPSSGLEFQPDLKVSDLILGATMEWNEGLLRNLFSEEAVSMILPIPLSLRSPHDALFWYPTSDGLFTVRSAYWLGKLGHEDWRQVGAFDRA